MKSLFTFVAIVALCQAAIDFEIIKKEWSLYKQTYGKVYPKLGEDLYRMKNYLKSKLEIEAHNAKYEKGLTTYKMGINKFADWTKQEFLQKMTVPRNSSIPRNQIYLNFIHSNSSDVPDSFDWRDKGAVTPIKDQGQCGSCWAFSTIGSLEGQHFLKTNNLVSLSEQQLVDCSINFNAGCGGGDLVPAFDYILSNGGIDTEESYPYEAIDDNCRFNPSTVGAQITGQVQITEGDEQALTEAIANIGPISICIDVSDNFMFYSGGVLDDNSCDSDYYSLNHCVTAVGYGQDGSDYYLVKNSWGADWGESGYIRMSRNKDNQCGVATEAIYPLV